MKQLRPFCIRIVLIFVIILPSFLFGQDDVGLPFLKIGVGARQAGMGSVFTGVGDDIYTQYWNPGGLGHIRRWQWSVAYNRWFSDVYQANISYVRQFRMWGSQKTTLGFRITYLGMPSWDATGGLESPVSAGHFVGGISFGQRLDWLHPSLGVGMNVNFLSSRLDTYSAKGVSTDWGLLFKPRRFALGKWGMGVFDYGIFTFGVSLLHFGTKMTFDREPSSLPRTLRIGTSLRMGRYAGWSALLATDVIQVKEQDWSVGIGSEVWWKETIGVRIGYISNGRDLGDFCFGLGFRWTDIMNSLLGLPTRFGDAFEVDVADVGYGDALQQTYRGTITHYPIAPEPFRLDRPQVVMSRVMGASSMVSMNWEKAHDPDPFDEVRYVVVVDRDKSRVGRAIHQAERNVFSFMSSALKDSLLVCEDLGETYFMTSVNEGGKYFWCVTAYDKGGHAQLAQRGEKQIGMIGEFVVTTHDLMVRSISFTPSPWITQTPEQGTLTFIISNDGNAASAGFRLRANDFPVSVESDSDSVTQIIDLEIAGLDVGEDTTVHVEWNSGIPGLHRIQATVVPYSTALEYEKDNNSLEATFLSIPKGEIVIPDSVEVMATGYDFTEIPIVPEVYFDPHSAVVKPEYYDDSSIWFAVLPAFAERLQDNPLVTMKILGFIDALSGEKDTQLADQRADNVRQRLESFGVPGAQISVVTNHSPKELGRRAMPADSMNALWIMQQNRVVRFQLQRKNEEKIFKPFEVAVDTTLRKGIPVDLAVQSPGNIQGWLIRGSYCQSLASEEPCSIEIENQAIGEKDSLTGHLVWDGTDKNNVLVKRDRWYLYALILTDTLGRTFSTRSDSIYIKEKQTIRKREVFGAAKFGQVEPVYQFYWDRLMAVAKEILDNSNMRIRFEGHACAIGSDAVNQRLSNRRANRFTKAFKDRVRSAYPTQYQSILKRIDPSAGFGEKEPLRLKLRGQSETLLGDNNTPVGRYLNRRIMVLLYREN